jgi:hypothetical protein
MFWKGIDYSLTQSLKGDLPVGSNVAFGPLFTTWLLPFKLSLELKGNFLGCLIPNLMIN